MTYLEVHAGLHRTVRALPCDSNRAALLRTDTALFACRPSRSTRSAVAASTGSASMRRRSPTMSPATRPSRPRPRGTARRPSRARQRTSPRRRALRPRSTSRRLTKFRPRSRRSPRRLTSFSGQSASSRSTSMLCRPRRTDAPTNTSVPTSSSQAFSFSTR